MKNILLVGFVFLITVMLSVSASATIYECDSCTTCQNAISTASSGDTIRLNQSSWYDCGVGNPNTCIDTSGIDNITIDGNDYGFYEIFGGAPCEAISVDSANVIIKNFDFTEDGERRKWDRVIAIKGNAVNVSVYNNIMSCNSTFSGGYTSCIGIQYFGGVTSLENNVYNNTIMNFSRGISMRGDIQNQQIYSNYILDSINYGIHMEDDDISMMYPQNNTFYNNYLNNSDNVHISVIMMTPSPNYFNITPYSGTNIVGGSYMAGNYYTNSSGTEFSDTCTDANSDYLCDESLWFGYAENYDNASLILVPDTSPPLITIDSPLNQSYGSLPVDLNVTLNETGDTCLYNTDGGSNNTMEGSGTSWNAEITGISEDIHQVQVYCNDSDGNMGFNGTVYFTYDATAPIIYVPVNISVNYQPYNVSITTSEDADSCWWESQSVDNTSMSGSDTSWYADLLPSASQGNFRIEFRCNDSANNIGYNDTFWLTYDWTAPNQTILLPENTTYLTTDTIYWNVTFTDSPSPPIGSENAVAMCISKDGNVTYETCDYDTSLFSGSDTLSAGFYNWTFRSNDTAGNYDWNQVFFTVEEPLAPSALPDFFRNFALAPVALIVLVGMAMWWWGEIGTGESLEDKIKRFLIAAFGVIIGIIALITIFTI